MARLVPVLVVFGLLAAILSSPLWGRFLKSYRKINSRTAELMTSRFECTRTSCVLTLSELAERDKLGAKMSLVYCINTRMNECFNEWARETITRLFPRVVCAFIAFLLAFALFGALTPQLGAFEPFRDLDLTTVFYVVLGVIFSATEIYTAIQMSGRYTEIVSTGNSLISEIERT
jgi:hypothetical protein